jgi:hypothetical protein
MKKIALILLVTLISVGSFAQKKEKKEKKSKKELKAEAEAMKNKVLLRYKLKQGESYVQDMDNDIKFQIMGMDIPMVQRISTKNIVTNVDASGNLTQESTIEKFYMKQSNPMMGDVEYDSEDASKQSPDLAAQVGGMKGTKTTLKMTPTGKTLEAPKEAGISNSSNQFPEQPIGVGDTWELSSTSKNQMLGNKEVTSNNQYKLLERNAGKAIIEVNGKMIMESKEIGSIAGKMTIDEATGIVLESNLLQKMNIEVQGMEAQVESKIKLTGKKL